MILNQLSNLMPEVGELINDYELNRIYAKL